MLERRNSDRVAVKELWVREENGDYLFSYSAQDISEEGIFLAKRMNSPDQEPFSRLSFTLPDGTLLRNLTGRVVREEKRGGIHGAAIQFLNMSEEVRLALKRFVISRCIHGNA